MKTFKEYLVEWNTNAGNEFAKEWNDSEALKKFEDWVVEKYPVDKFDREYMSKWLVRIIGEFEKDFDISIGRSIDGEVEEFFKSEYPELLKSELK